jgi:hypothetical protein
MLVLILRKKLYHLALRSILAVGVSHCPFFSMIVAVTNCPTRRDACVHWDDQPAGRELNASAVARCIAGEPIAHATRPATHARHVLWCSPAAAFIVALHHPYVPVVAFRPPWAPKEQESVASDIIIERRWIPHGQAMGRSETFP